MDKTVIYLWNGNFCASSFLVYITLPLWLTTVSVCLGGLGRLSNTLVMFGVIANLKEGEGGVCDLSVLTYDYYIHSTGIKC